MVQFLLHRLAHLELNATFGRDVNLFEGFWVLPLPGCSIPHLEDAEIPKLQPVPPAQFVHDLIEEGLYNFFGRYCTELMGFSDFVNKRLFRDGCYGRFSDLRYIKHSVMNNKQAQ